MKHRHAPAAVLLSPPLAVLSAAPSQAASSRAGGEFGHLFLDGAVVRTLGTPSPLPHGGRDLIYAFPSGVAGQLAGMVAGAEQVLVTVTRNAAADFRCPVLP